MALSADDLPKEPAPIVMASRSSEFVGPMPVVTPARTMPAPIVIEHAGAELLSDAFGNAVNLVYGTIQNHAITVDGASG